MPRMSAMLSIVPIAGLLRPRVSGRLWDEAKNISAIERVASRLNWPVRLAGPEVPDASHGFCAASCEFLGRLARHDLLALMGRASIYAAPSLYEPFGLSVLEAAG